MKELIITWRGVRYHIKDETKKARFADGTEYVPSGYHGKQELRDQRTQICFVEL